MEPFAKSNVQTRWAPALNARPVLESLMHPVILLALALIPWLFSHSAAAQDAERFPIRMEVHLPDWPGPPERITLNSEQDIARIQRATSPVKYTASSSSIPARQWRRMVKLGTLPPHDFVLCMGKNCIFGTDGAVADSLEVQVAARTTTEGVVATVRYSAQRNSVDRCSCAASPCVDVPSSTSESWVKSSTLSPGTSTTFGHARPALRIDLVQ